MPTAEHRDFSTQAFEYALLANNSYGKADRWIELPADTSLVEECDNDEIGLAYSVFRRSGPAGRELIVAFRGTEDGEEGEKDWKYGNLSYRQQRRSEPIVSRILSQNPGEPIMFLGHSLGGALAIHNSMRAQGHRVYVFNSSPMFYAPPGYKPSLDPTQRLSIIERGEVLKPVRIFFKEAWQTYMPFNCYSKGGPVFQHSVLRLAVCLTRIAASEPGTAAARRARDYLDRNPWAVVAATHPLRERKPSVRCFH